MTDQDYCQPSLQYIPSHEEVAQTLTDNLVHAPEEGEENKDRGHRTSQKKMQKM